MNMTQDLHPSPEQLLAFVSGRLDEAESSAIASHLADCADCCTLLESQPADSLIAKLQASARPDAPSGSEPANKEDQQSSPTATNALSSPGNIELPADLAAHPRYRVQEWLGTGGMGTVYRAEHLIMERAVALKVIRRQLIAKPAAIERFRHEVKMAARLVHPNIVTAYDADQAGETHFLVMELVAGTSLDRLVKEKGPLSVAEACDYVRQAALGLQYACERGMVHRDIKPPNLIRTADGLIKILDFGLAHLGRAGEGTGTLPSSETLVAGTLTLEGEVMGTPDYMAPEQARSPHTTDIRADIYSLGCTFYYLLTGQAPFHEGTALQKLQAHAALTPKSLTELRRDLPSKLVRVIERMMAKDPARRYQTPAEVARALVSFLRPEVARKLSHGELPWHTQWQFLLRRYKRRLVTAASVLLAAVGILAAPTMIRIATNQGTLVVETDDPDGDPDVRVIVLKGGKPARVVDPKSKPQIDLKPGVYEIKLAGGDNELRLSHNKFTLTRGSWATVTVWRDFTPGETRCFKGHEGGVWDVAFSPDGRRFLSASHDGTMRLWDVKKGQEIRCFKGHTAGLWGVAFSPDGRIVLSGSEDRTVRWWDVETGKELGRLQEPTGRIRSVVFSQDGQRILACGLRAARLWDVKTKKELQRFERFPGNLVHWAVRLWDVKPSRELQRFERFTGNRVHWAVFSPDERRVLTGDESTVRLWDVESGKQIRPMLGHATAVSSVAFSPDGRYAASGSHDKTVRLWDAETGQELHRFVGHRGVVERVAFSPDGQRILSGSGDKTLRLWDVESRRELYRFEGHTASVMGIAFSRDGRFALSGSDDCTVRLVRLPEPATPK
jgi:WD40 repeat protein/serine/threonine protein kinase